MHSSAGESEAEATSMTKRQAYDLLGVKEGAGFDEILSVKKKLIAGSSGDRERELQVWAFCGLSGGVSNHRVWQGKLETDSAAAECCRSRWHMTSC